MLDSRSRPSWLSLCGFIVVASQAFSPSTTAWLAFAIGIGAVALAGVPFVAGARRGVLALDGVIGVLAVWTIVASLVFAGSLVQWLSFGEGVGFVALALAGLTVDHVLLSRSAHRGLTSATETVPTVERPTAVAA